jgi:hypothetical protein
LATKRLTKGILDSRFRGNDRIDAGMTVEG